MWDVNGSGTITSSDLIAVRNLQNTVLPIAEPPAATSMSVLLSASRGSVVLGRSRRNDWIV
jgi:hypothetical protein